MNIFCFGNAQNEFEEVMNILEKKKSIQNSKKFDYNGKNKIISFKSHSSPFNDNNINHNQKKTSSLFEIIDYPYKQNHKDIKLNKAHIQQESNITLKDGITKMIFEYKNKYKNPKEEDTIEESLIHEAKNYGKHSNKKKNDNKNYSIIFNDYYESLSKEKNNKESKDLKSFKTNLLTKFNKIEKVKKGKVKKRKGIPIKNSLFYDTIVTNNTDLLNEKNTQYQSTNSYNIADNIIPIKDNKKNKLKNIPRNKRNKINGLYRSIVTENSNIKENTFIRKQLTLNKINNNNNMTMKINFKNKTTKGKKCLKEYNTNKNIAIKIPNTSYIVQKRNKITIDNNDIKHQLINFKSMKNIQISKIKSHSKFIAINQNNNKDYKTYKPTSSKACIYKIKKSNLTLRKSYKKLFIN